MSFRLLIFITTRGGLNQLWCRGSTLGILNIAMGAYFDLYLGGVGELTDLLVDEWIYSRGSTCSSLPNVQCNMASCMLLEHIYVLK